MCGHVCVSQCVCVLHSQTRAYVKSFSFYFVVTCRQLQALVFLSNANFSRCHYITQWQRTLIDLTSQNAICRLRPHATLKQLQTSWAEQLLLLVPFYVFCLYSSFPYIFFCIFVIFRWHNAWQTCQTYQHSSPILSSSTNHNLKRCCACCPLRPCPVWPASASFTCVLRILSYLFVLSIRFMHI